MKITGLQQKDKGVVWLCVGIAFALGLGQVSVLNLPITGVGSIGAALLGGAIILLSNLRAVQESM